MSTVPDKLSEEISLHGLGFIQVVLPNNRRLHVWHPDLPRRSCFKDSAIHDHRWAFRSTLLVGALRNLMYMNEPVVEGEFMSYLHEGARTACGGRPWVPDGCVNLIQIGSAMYVAGESYRQAEYIYHRTEVLSQNGFLATVIKKVNDGGDKGAHSLCTSGVKPDDDFDRFQLPTDVLWAIVHEVLDTAAAGRAVLAELRRTTDGN